MSISNEALDEALERVSYMFPSTVSTFQASSAKFQLQRVSTLNRDGRNRVDSQARPAEFLRNIKKDREDLERINIHEFGLHGVHEPVLRQRMESKAIDPKVLDRVLGEFQLHAKLSEQDLSMVHDMADQAYQLRKDNDDVQAEKLFEEVKVPQHVARTLY